MFLDTFYDKKYNYNVNPRLNDYLIIEVLYSL